MLPEPTAASNADLPQQAIATPSSDAPDDLFDLDYDSKLYVSYATDWSKAAFALSTQRLESYSWDIPKNLKPEDLLITVLQSDPALVACIERFEVSGDELIATERVIFSTPITLKSLENASRILFPVRSGRIDGEVRDLLQTLKILHENPQPEVLLAPDCADRSLLALGSAAVVSRLLHEPGYFRSKCQACEEEYSEIEGHFFEVFPQGTKYKITDLAASMVLLCNSCHALAHPQSLQDLRNARRPVCPTCKEVNPRQYRSGWFQPPRDDRMDSYVSYGCTFEGTIPDFKCRNCETDYVVCALTEDGDIAGFEDEESILNEETD